MKGKQGAGCRSLQLCPNFRNTGQKPSSEPRHGYPQLSPNPKRTSCILAEMTLAACLADGLVMYCSASTSLSSVSLSMAIGRGPTPALPQHDAGLRARCRVSGLRKVWVSLYAESCVRDGCDAGADSAAASNLMRQVSAEHAGAERSTAEAEQDTQQPAGFRLEGRWYSVLCASQAAFLSADLHISQGGLLITVWRRHGLKTMISTANQSRAQRDTTTLVTAAQRDSKKVAPSAHLWQAMPQNGWSPKK